MEIIICILSIIILMLFFYIILLKKDIRRITNQIKEIRRKKSNLLLNKELGEKNISNLIKEINAALAEIHKQESEMYVQTEEMRLMITNVAHDLRTPLTSAIGYLELIQNSNLPEEQKEKYINIITERLNKLSYLITNFFEFSKIVSNNEEVEKHNENLVQIIEEAIIGFYQNFSKENRQINFTHEKNKIEIKTNKNLLMRILDNLIINAYKHSQSDLEIIISENESSIKMEFINELRNDNLDINAMFDKFYTADTSRTDGNTGLGLAIVKEFVQLLNGEIHAKKEENLLSIVIVMYKIV